MPKIKMNWSVVYHDGKMYGPGEAVEVPEGLAKSLGATPLPEDEGGPEAAEPAAGEPVDPEKLRKDELLAMAGERGVTVPDGATKQEIADALNAVGEGQ